MLCMSMMVCFAQNSTVKNIRERYAAALERVQMMLEERNAANYATTKMTTVLPAIGPVDETFECFAFDANDDEENSTTPDFRPFFIRTKLDATPTALGIKYREYLFNDKDGTLIFCYSKTSGFWAEDEVWMEDREYFDDKGKFVTNNFKLTSRESGEAYPTGDFESDNGESSIEAAKKLFNAFTAIMNIK